MPKSYDYQQGEYDGKIKMLDFLHKWVVLKEKMPDGDLGNEKMNEIRDHLTSRMTMLKVADTEIGKMQQQADGYRKRADRLEAERDELKAKAEGYAEHNRALQDELANADGKLAEINKELGVLNDEVKSRTRVAITAIQSAAGATPVPRAGNPLGVHADIRMPASGDDG